MWSCAMMARPASLAARRTSALAPTQFLPCLLRRKPVWQSRKSKGCSAIQIVRLRVNSVVVVIDSGRIINPLAGRNQIEGAVVMGISMAMLEHTTYDPQNGAPINSNLADYIVAMNADVPKLEVHFLDYTACELNAVGARGIGEIGLAGIAAAITAATYHATGVRVRELPIKIEDLLTSSVLA